jgi:hypothetical protein
MSISSNGATPVSVPIANPTQTIGLIQPGLSVSVRNTRSIQNCTNTPPPTSASSPGGFRLRFEEGFGSSFKKTGVRLVLDPFVALTTETGIVPGEAPAAAGTRLRANFKNIPPGVSLFVTSHNVDAGFDTGISIANTVPGVPPNQPLALLPVSNGTATAVWEVINTDPAAKENMEFGVWFSFTGLSGGQALHITSDGGIQDLDPLTIPGAPFTPTVSTFSSAGARPFVVTSIVPCANTPQTEAPGSVLTSTDKTPCLLFNNSVCNPWLGAVTTSLEHDGLKTQATSTDASLQLTKTGGDPPDDHTPLNLSTLIKNVSAQPRSSEVKVSISSNTGTTLNQATFPVTILSPTNPLLIPENYTDVSDYTSGKASPGQIFSIFPKNFSGPAALVSSAIDANGILSNKVDDTQVFFGNDPAALLFVTANQITGIAPNSLAGKSSVPLKIVRKSETSPIINLPVVPSSLAIVSADGSGGGALRLPEFRRLV